MSKAWRDTLRRPEPLSSVELQLGETQLCFNTILSAAEGSR